MSLIVFPLIFIITILITVSKKYLTIFTDNIIVSLLLFIFSILAITLLIKFEGKVELKKDNFTYQALNILFSIFSLILLSLTVFSILSSLKII